MYRSPKEPLIYPIGGAATLLVILGSVLFGQYQHIKAQESLANHEICRQARRGDVVSMRKGKDLIVGGPSDRVEAGTRPNLYKVTCKPLLASVKL